MAAFKAERLAEMRDERSFVAAAIETERLTFAGERDALRRQIREERRAAEKRRRERRVARRDQREHEARAEAALVREAYRLDDYGAPA